MSDWLNMVTINVARNGTTSHTVNPSSTGTVVAGSAFTPTAGRLLVAVVEGAVTSTTPSGWTLPAGGSAINNTGLYVWYRTAAGSDSITTTHNGSNYPIVVTFFEFAAGSSFVASVSGIGYNPTTGANPNLTGLTGTNWLGAAKASGLSSGSSYTSSAWSASGASPVKIVDTSATYSSTDGYAFTLAELNASTLSAYQPLANMTGGFPSNCEAITFAVSVAAGGGGTNYTANPADTAGSTDSASSVQSFTRAPTDPAGITDTAAASQSFDRSTADPAGIADVATTDTAMPRAVADSSGGTDSTTVAQVFDRPFSEAVGGADALQVLVASTRTFGDQAGLTDSVSAVLASGALVTPADALGGTDAVTVVVSVASAPADALAGADATAVVQSVQRAASDPAGLSDVIASALTFSRAAADVAGLTDQVAAVITAGAAGRDITVIIGEPYGHPLTIGSPRANPLRIGEPVGHPLVIGSPRS